MKNRNIRDIIVRPATIDDLEAILVIEQRAFRKDRFSRPQYIYLLTKANSTVFLLVTGKKVTGTAVMLWRRNSKTGRLYNIAVDPDFQGSGMGEILLEACEGECLKRSCTRISLEVRSDNRGAIKFYRNRRYDITMTLRRYYSDGTDGIRMVKKLSR
jgi:ribosomal-protein-alanine N-acetyltransferase